MDTQMKNLNAKPPCCVHIWVTMLEEYVDTGGRRSAILIKSNRPVSQLAHKADNWERSEGRKKWN